MADKDAFCYPYHVDDCTPPQEKLPDKGPFLSEMPPKNSVSKSHSFIFILRSWFKPWHTFEICFSQSQSKDEFE